MPNEQLGGKVAQEKNDRPRWRGRMLPPIVDLMALLRNLDRMPSDLGAHRLRSYAFSIASFVMAAAALVLAVVALDMAGRALRHQHEPHLVVTSQTEPQRGELGLFLENQGHAPAKITRFEIQLDGQPMADWHSVTAALAERRIQLFPNYEPDGRVPAGELLYAGDQIGIYSIPPKRLNVFDLTMIKKLFDHEIGIKIEYCSLLSECQIYCRNMNDCSG